jgi:hypothetical protein
MTPRLAQEHAEPLAAHPFPGGQRRPYHAVIIIPV